MWCTHTTLQLGWYQALYGVRVKRYVHAGLDARAAAAVMSAVRNVASNGRTVMVTIHQPSVEIFESFDALVLLGMGGTIIYSGPLGQQSANLIRYFQVRTHTCVQSAVFNLQCSICGVQTRWDLNHLVT